MADVLPTLAIWQLSNFSFCPGLDSAYRASSTDSYRSGIFAGGPCRQKRRAAQCSFGARDAIILKSIAGAVLSEVLQHEGGAPPVFFPQPELPWTWRDARRILAGCPFESLPLKRQWLPKDFCSLAFRDVPVSRRDLDSERCRR